MIELTNIIRTCEVENTLIQGRGSDPCIPPRSSPLSNQQLQERLMVTNDLVRMLTLIVQNHVEVTHARLKPLVQEEKESA